MMDIKEIKKIVTLVESADISILKLETKDGKIEIQKENSHSPKRTTAPPVQHVAEAPVVQQSASPVPVSTEKDAALVAIKSPMVGTFYEASSPETDPYVKDGVSVKKGQTVCIIEAMKLFNEIESEFDGTVEKVLIKNAASVEYGQELFLIRKT